MKRPIVDFEQDEEGHWVARLSCGHAQHTRHNPPIVERPWVLSAEGRRAKLGTDLDCLRCDRFEVPDSHAPYQRTRHFNRDSVPNALLQAHSTKVGVWALIHVVRGELGYFVEPPIESHCVLTQQSPGIVVPEVLHRVELRGDVEFYVEFWKSL